ncbi:unnamed protein product [Alopecurus aequalis]
MENDGFVSGPDGIRVLVVEEDPSDLATLTQTLQRLGYQATAKASPEDGLRALRDNPEGFDLVLTVVRTQGTRIDGFDLLKHAAKRYPVILFSGQEPRETVTRAMVGGACDILIKPLRDEVMQNIWQHVLRRQLHAASGAAVNVVVRQDDTARKRGFEALDGADQGGSHGRRQQKQARTTMFNSPQQLYASVVKAAEQLRGTEGRVELEAFYNASTSKALSCPPFRAPQLGKMSPKNADYSPRGVLDLLVAQGVEITLEQARSHLEIYKKECLTNHVSPMSMASSSHSNNMRNYSTPGSLGFHMRSQGTTDINQTSLLRNGASPVGYGVYGNESYNASQARHNQYSGNFHGNANGYHYGNGVNGSMVAASLPSNLAQQVHGAMPEDYGNDRGGLVQNGSMVGASLPSSLAQPVQQAMPTYNLFPTTMDNPNPTGQHEFSQISRLRYDGDTGGILMLPWPVPVDDGEDLLRSYLEGENEVMQNTATTQGMPGDGAAGQTSASQPDDFTQLFSWESPDENGTADTADGSGVVTDGIVDCELNTDEIINFF